MPEISFEVHHTLQPIKAQWIELEQQARQRISSGQMSYMLFSFYQSYGWAEFIEQSYRRRHYLFKSGKRLDYILILEDGSPVAILPLIASLRIKRIDIIHAKIAGLLNVVSPRHSETDLYIYQALTAYLSQRYHGWRMTFHDIPQQSPFATALRSIGGAEIRERASYCIDLTSFGSFDEYFASLSKNLYKNTRKAYNHIKSDGHTFALRWYNNSEMPRGMALWRLWNIYFTRKLAWKSRSANPFAKAVCAFRAALETHHGMKSESMYALPNSRLAVFEIDGHTAAFMLLYIDGQHILMPKLAIDTKYSRYSPGILLVLESLKEFFSEGIMDFDMCRGNERYKRDVGGLYRPLSYVTVESL